VVGELAFALDAASEKILSTCILKRERNVNENTDYCLAELLELLRALLELEADNETRCIQSKPLISTSIH
jgi:hypothetical protein